MTDAKQTKTSRRDVSRSFDEALGAKIRALRHGTGMNQTELGARLGFSYQQMQKYETGKDRMSAYTLQQIALLLDTPITVFFDDTPLPSGSRPEVREAMKAVSAIQKIEHSTLRRRLLDLIAELTKTNADRVNTP